MEVLDWLLCAFGRHNWVYNHEALGKVSERTCYTCGQREMPLRDEAGIIGGWRLR